jgi:PAS domain S-box-containing protein
MNECTEADYRRIFEQAPGHFLLIRPDPSFTILGASDAYLRATFTSRERMVGRGLFDVLPVDPAATRAAANLKMRRSLEKVVATRRADTMEVQRFDVFLPQGDGGSVERFWSAVNSPVCSSDGSLLYIVHSIEDVTEFVVSSRAMQTDDDALRLEILNRGRQLAAANQQLREVVSQFQAMYDEGLFAGRIALDGALIDANRSSLEECGYTLEEVVGRPFWECGWWNRSADVQAWVKNAVERAARGEPFRGVSMYFWSDGTERIADFACRPIKDELGSVQFVFATGMDVTERVSTERNLRATEILESITQGFFAVDPTWRFTYVNREAQRLFDRAPNELLGNDVWTELPAMRGTVFDAAFRRAMHERIVTGPITAFYPPHRRWYELQTYPATEGITVYFRDVTAQVETKAERERLAAESERQRRIYEAALSNTPDLVYVVDAERRVLYANEALLDMLRMKRDEAVGETTLALEFPPGHAQAHAREIDRVIETGMPSRNEVPIAEPLTQRVYDNILVPVLGPDGKVVAVAATARDITERQAAEQAMRQHAEALSAADRAKDEFLATLAHELRNPLAPLRNAVHLFRAFGDADDKTESLISLMERQLNHLIRLVDDLLEISRITRGAFALRKEKIALADVVRNAIDTSKPLIEAARHAFSVALPDEPLWLEGDPVRLAQIVANLLNNAARYTDDQGRIDVQAQRLGDKVAISVTDNGIGIEPQALPRVFEMFSREAEGNVRGGGLGIGLALARRLAAMHGGTVEGYSAGRGCGSRFVVELPLAASRSDAHTTGEPSVARADTAFGPWRILVVDDNRDAAESLAMILETFGAETVVACSGADALQRLKTLRPNVVFLDIGMPLMDGYEVARRIRAAQAGPQPVLIALTGWGQREDRRKARDAGFDHHIVKPAEIGALRALLASLRSAGAAPTSSPEERARGSR